MSFLNIFSLQHFLKNAKKFSVRLLSAGAAALIMCSMTGCSSIQPVEDLMSPPVLTKEQAQIRSALSYVSGENDIKYKYPQNGDYRSSFIFYDIDSDGVEEALVFYQCASKGDATWINILDQQENEEWVSVYETPAPDTTANIDFVAFEHLMDKDEINLVIGWEDARNNKTVIAYAYQNGRLLPIFERDYNEIAITDLDSNGSTDLVLFTQQAQTTLVFLACKTENGFETVDSISLSHGIVSFDSIQSGRTLSNGNALFLDSTIDLYETPFQMTDVISAKQVPGSSPILVNLLDDETHTLSQETLRSAQNLFCRDIDDDGILEIPSVTILPGYDNIFDEDALFLTTYNMLGSNFQLIPTQSGVINTQNRYMVVFPKRWLNNRVSAAVQSENGEYTFFEYTGELSDTSAPLLRIRVYSAKDYHDKFDSDYFTQIAQKGLFEYYVYGPASTGELAITEQELIEEMFVLLD